MIRPTSSNIHYYDCVHCHNLIYRAFYLLKNDPEKNCLCKVKKKTIKIATVKYIYLNVISHFNNSYEIN